MTQPRTYENAPEISLERIAQISGALPRAANLAGWSRGIDLGMIGEGDKGTARWELAVFFNRFVKEDGVWKLAKLDVHPLIAAVAARACHERGRARACCGPRRSAPPPRALDGVRGDRKRLGRRRLRTACRCRDGTGACADSRSVRLQRR